MLKKIAFAVLASAIVSGCATVPMADKELSSKAKTFAEPPAGKGAPKLDCLSFYLQKCNTMMFFS